MNIISGKFINAENTRADLVIDHPVYGEIPYTYDTTDPHGCITVEQVSAADLTAYVSPTQSELDTIKAEQERGWRDNELSTVVDHNQMPLVWADLTTDQQTAIAAYRRLLLDYPQTIDFPNGTRPEFIEA